MLCLINRQGVARMDVSHSAISWGLPMEAERSSSLACDGQKIIVSSQTTPRSGSAKYCDSSSGQAVVVSFDDGITITAVMPEECYFWYNPNVRHTRQPAVR